MPMLNNAQLQQVLSDWRQWGLTTAPIQAQQVKQLPQGLTNQGYLLNLAGQQYVLRIAATNSQELGINREAEFQIQQLLEQHQLAPKVVYRAPDNSYWLREYVAGQVLTPADLSLDILQEMAAYLQKIHQLAAPATIPVINLQEKIQSYQQQLDITPPHSPFTILNSPLTNHHSKLRLCHMDPTAANWIRTENGQLVLLDWEYAGLGNPLWDMATMVLQAQLTEPQEQEFRKFIQQQDDETWQQAKEEISELARLWYVLQEKMALQTY